MLEFERGNVWFYNGGGREVGRFANPQIAITVANKTTFYHGFGKYAVNDAHGKLMYWLVVKAEK